MKKYWLIFVFLFPRLVICKILDKLSSECPHLWTLQLLTHVIQREGNASEICKVTTSWRHLIRSTTQPSTLSKHRIRPWWRSSFPSHSMTTCWSIRQNIAGLYKICYRTLWSSSGCVWWLWGGSFNQRQHTSAQEWSVRIGEYNVASVHEVPV